MAWVAEDDFESYSAGDNWNGANGGSGWSTSWSITDTGTEYDLVSSPTLQGNICAHTDNANGGGTGGASRTLTTAVTSGTVYFLIRKDSTTASNGLRLAFANSGGGTEYFPGRFFGSVIDIVSTGGNETLDGGASASADTTYEIAAEFDTSVPQYRAKMRTQGGSWGSWSSWKAPAGGSGTTGIVTVQVQHLGTDTGVDCFVDRISATEESAGGGGSATPTLAIMGVGT